MDPKEQQVAQPTSTQPSQELHSDRPSSFNWTKMLLIVVVVLIMAGIGFGGYYLGIRKNESMISNQQARVSPTSIQPTPTPDPTTGWKTYSDTVNSISVKYPSDWSYDATLLATLKTIGFGPGNYKIPLQTEARIPVSLTIKGENYDVVVKRYIDSYGTQNQQTISAGGLQGVYIGGTITQLGPAQGFSGGAFILNESGKAIEFSYSVINGTDYKDIAEKMVESLKITSQSDISNWKSYTDGISFTMSYPDTWTLKGDAGIQEFYDPNSMKSELQNGNGGSLLVPTQYINISILNISQTPKQYVDDLFTKVPYNTDTNAQNSRKVISLNGNVAELYLETGEGSKGYDLVISDGKHLLVINIPTTYPSTNSLINQILASIKFTK